MANNSHSILDITMKSLIKPNTFGFIIQSKRCDEGCEVDGIESGRFGLLKNSKLCFTHLLVVLVKIEIVKSSLKGCIIIVQGIRRVDGDVAYARESITTKEGNHEKNLLFVGVVDVGTHGERESALRNKVVVFRDFA